MEQEEVKRVQSIVWGIVAFLAVCVAGGVGCGYIAAHGPVRERTFCVHVQPDGSASVSQAPAPN